VENAPPNHEFKASVTLVYSMTKNQNNGLEKPSRNSSSYTCMAHEAVTSDKTISSQRLRYQVSSRITGNGTMAEDNLPETFVLSTADN
jgi:hypothetical protein